MRITIFRHFLWLMIGLLLVAVLTGSVIADNPQKQESLTADNPVEILAENNNYFLKVDLQDSRVHPQVVLANEDSGGTQSLFWMANRFASKGYKEWAIINGDLFSTCSSDTNCAQGLTYIAGQHKLNWNAYGDTWKVRGNIGLNESRNVEIGVGDGQSKRYMTIAGGPRVLMGGNATCEGEVHDGKTLFPASGEWFDGDVRGWCNNGRAITMIGYGGGGRYLYMGTLIAS